jgi:hypothetical protein
MPFILLPVLNKYGTWLMFAIVAVAIVIRDIGLFALRPLEGRSSISLRAPERA